MPELIEGNYNCEKDGTFHWNGYYFEKGESKAIFGKWKDLKTNFIEAEPLKNQILITIKCPTCRKIYTLYKDK